MADMDEMIDCPSLLTKREMKQLLQDCRIITERVLWAIPKSHIAVHA